MDEEGWIPLNIISNFNRIKYLTTDTNTLIETIKSSTALEYKDEKIRRKEDWKTWVIPKVTAKLKFC
jgi:la-related protein 1